MANRLRNWLAGLVLVVWFGAMLAIATDGKSVSEDVVFCEDEGLIGICE